MIQGNLNSFLGIESHKNLLNCFIFENDEFYNEFEIEKNKVTNRKLPLTAVTVTQLPFLKITYKKHKNSTSLKVI